MGPMRLLWIFLLLAELLAAQPALQLKPHPAQSAHQFPNRRRGMARHLLVRFASGAEPGQLFELAKRGARVVQYVPDYAYIISAPDWFTADGLGLSSSSPIGPAEKLSAELADAADTGDASFALVEFYPDVDMDQARQIVLDSLLQIQDNPDLLDHHLLVSGTQDAISALAQWDEVAYIFPAAPELVQGLALNACAGALTDQGQIGQSVARVGYGWGGPGLNGADLNYAFQSVTDKIPTDTAKAEIVRAFNEWAKVAKLTFSPSTDLKANRTLTVLFGSGPHGDAYPFDGRGGVLAHTFYPYPTNAEPIAGDLHFDADENWHSGADTDLFSVALHETGHALGLGHSDKPGAVMYPYYRRATALTQEDITAILTLYSAQDATPGITPAALPLTLTVQDTPATTTFATLGLSGSTSGGAAGVQVRWALQGGVSGIASGSTSWSIAGVPLGPGLNTIVLTATDSLQATASRTLTVIRQLAAQAPLLPMIQVTSPTSSSSPTMTISGTASAADGIARITWSSSQGRSGQASGTLNWTIGPITLTAGANTFTIAAYSQSGISASQTIQIQYAAPATPSTPSAPSNDTTPPSLAIVAPAMITVSTSSSTLAFSGTAKDNVGVASVTWSTSNGDSGTCAGTDHWQAAAIPLYVGTNTVTIRAHDAAGNTAWRSVVVTRH